MKIIPAEAVLFDLDGVLVDSLALIERILRAWAVSRGLDADAAVALSRGRRDLDLVTLLAPHLDPVAETRRIVAAEEADLTGLRAVPGAAGLLAALPAHRWAVVTSGTRLVATGRLRAVGLPLPTVLVAAEDTGEGKPDPEGYLAAAAALGVPPERCVVVEDAPAGLAAARGAGMARIGLGAAVRAQRAELDAWVPDLRPVRATVTATGVTLSLPPAGPGD
ncbi:HAD-IA family hydrolase [Longispora urticae]